MKIEDVGKSMLKSRVARLARLIELDAPDVILCSSAALVFRAACMINPESAGGAIASALRDRHAYEKRICLFCLEAPWDGDSTLCAKCAKEITEEFEDKGEDDDSR